MKKYAIVTDSTTYFTNEEFAKYGIKRASLNIISGHDTVRELDVENSYIYKKFDEGFKLTTSQPAPGEFLEIYEELLKEGYEYIFVLVISDKLSGTYQSAKLALNMLDNPEKVYAFESNMAAYGNEMLILQLMEYIDNALPAEDIITKMNQHIKTAHLIMTSEDLTSIIKSGRLSKTKAMLGTILRVKPVIKMENGKLDLMTSSRTSKKAVVHMLEFLKNEMNENYEKLHIRICSHNSIEYANKLKEEVLNTYRNVKITVSEYIGPVFNVHVGPKGFGLSFFTE